MYSDAENRSLAQKPKLTWSSFADGSWFSGVSDWYSDQFFARDSWISLNLKKERALGKKESGGVLLGKEDYLISLPETPDSTAVIETTKAINTFISGHPNLNAYILLAPGASQILTEYLPQNAPVRNQLADISAVYGMVDASVTQLDGVSPLQEHSPEELYYHTDHHWTSLGAYYVFMENAEKMGLSPGEFSPYTVTGDFEGTLASKSGSHSYKDTIQIYQPKDDVSYYTDYMDGSDRVCSLYQRACLNSKDKYTVFFGGNHALVEIHTTADNGRSLLLFKDSYANCFVQFLYPYFERVIMIDPRYYYDNVETVLNNYGITDVLFLYSADTFLADRTLKNVLAGDG